MKVLVTGVAGFIGMHCARRLLERGEEVLGIDSLAPGASLSLKNDRLAELGHPKFAFTQLDISHRDQLSDYFARHRPRRVLHLAAQAGVRASLENPHAYVQSNLVGFANILDCCRRHPPERLVFASSSSVYGANARLPFSEGDNVDQPLSFYAATKRANELMAYSYSHVHGAAATALRYFTVYGPWGRPDMSPMLFATAIAEGRPIAVFNGGDMQRDFTYIGDAVEATLRLLERPAKYAVYNIGNRRPIALLDYIAAMERALGMKARLEMKPMQPGEVKATCADTRALERAIGFAPSTPLDEGLARFAAWFRAYPGTRAPSRDTSTGS